ncbi:cytochrome P450 3A5-like [Acanthaster planci]|uniref:Cytochrome P450 3A5-like n=1 Tax=Acanthaster planci TaxID=133434 RepID=A0A8B7ZF52_ACAPL|nr:cytochrome P450 3A5-like [Acanthaster planci]
MENEGVSRSVSEEGWQPPLFAASTWTLIIAAISLFFVYDYWRHHYLARIGIAGPKPKPFFGNFLEMIFHTNGVWGWYEDIIEKYGKVAGCYMGGSPIVIIGDVEWVRQLCIKDFASFVNRRSETIDNKPFHKSLTTLRDSHWKDVRGILSPTFSGSKMKLMAPIVNDCLDPMIRKVTRLNKEGKGLEFKEVYSGFLIDAIGNTAFGLTLNSQENSDDPFLHNARDIFKFRFSIAILVVLLAPILSPVVNFFNLTTFDRKTLKFFEDVLDHAVEVKRAGTAKRVDFLQLMLDAQERTEDDKAEATEEEKQEEEHRAKMSKKTLTADEIKSQVPTCRLKGIIDDGKEYITCTVMYVMDNQCVNQLARIHVLHSFALHFLVQEKSHFVLHNRKPISRHVLMNRFLFPQRFSPEQREKRHPCAYIPFGAGPRSCIAMRFALMQVKMALVRMLQNFRLETCEETEIPPVLSKFGSLTPAKGFRLAAVPRS